MVFLLVGVAVAFMALMLSSKKKWIIPLGWVLIFVAGTWLYGVMYLSELGVVDMSLILTAALSSVRNFLANNDYVAYAGSVSGEIFLAATIVCLLSMFMTILTAVKIMLAYFSGGLFVMLWGRSKHICVFTDNSGDTVRLARSAGRCIRNALCVFLDCGRVGELEGERNVLFLNEAAGKHLRNTAQEIFVCGAEEAENIRVAEKLRERLPHGKYYVFAEDHGDAINREELLVRYLFVAQGFVPAEYTQDKQAEICLVGDNKLAPALCKELIVQCQSRHGLPRITIIGANGEDNFAFFMKANPGLAHCAELTFVNAPPQSVAGIAALTERVYQMYFFCEDNKKLPQLVPAEKVVELPAYEAIYDYDIIVNFSLDKEAKELHAEYERLYGKGKEGAIIDADAEWRNLPEFQRQSNRSQAIHKAVHRHLYNMGVSLEQLAQEEHLRWNAFHYVNGWTYGKGPDGKKVVEQKLHPCLLPYEQLSQEEKDKDMLFVQKNLSHKEERK